MRAVCRRDFGHFLGHVTEFLGMNRDKTPFILTDEFLVIMGRDDRNSPNFMKFRDLCSACFLAVRRKAHWFVNLVSLMVIAGLGELEGKKELDFIRGRFMLELDDRAAEDRFKALIDVSLGTLTCALLPASDAALPRRAAPRIRRRDLCSLSECPFRMPAPAGPR